MTTETKPCEYCGTSLTEYGANATDGTHHFAAQCREYVHATLRSYRRELSDYRGLVDDLLTVWQGYAETQCASAEGCRRQVLAERAQCMLDVKLALKNPKTITWPDGHMRSLFPVAHVNPEKTK